MTDKEKIYFTPEFLRSFRVDKDNIKVIAPSPELAVKLIEEMEKQVFLSLEKLKALATRTKLAGVLMDQIYEPGFLSMEQIKHIRKGSNLMREIILDCTKHEEKFFD